MDRRSLTLLLLAVWVTPIAALFYAHHYRIRYLTALWRCLVWAAVLVLCMEFNYLLVDALHLSRGSSGYVRGKRVISEYGFLAQLLLVVEIGVLYVLVRTRRNGKVSPSLQEPQTIVPPPPPPPAKQIDDSVQPDKRELQSTRRFQVSGRGIAFAYCAVWSFWMGLRGLNDIVYALAFIALGVGLLVIAYKFSFSR